MKEALDTILSELSPEHREIVEREMYVFPHRNDDNLLTKAISELTFLWALRTSGLNTIDGVISSILPPPDIKDIFTFDLCESLLKGDIEAYLSLNYDEVTAVEPVPQVIEPDDTGA